MLALEFLEPGQMRVTEMPEPEIGPRDLLVRVHTSGICGTDLHIFRGSYPATFPLVPGHEYSGIVEGVGPELEGFVVGDAVVVDPNILCGACFYCRSGNVHLCSNMVALGVNLPGGFAELSRVPARQAYRLPKGLPLDQAALSEPVACCLRGMDLAEVRSGDRVAIFGAGPIGVIMLQLAQMQGASTVIMIDPQAGRRRLAEAHGADWVIDPLEEAVESAVRRQFPEGVEVVFDCSGNIEAVKETLKLVMRGGKVILYGVCEEGASFELNPFWVNENEITIRGAYNNPNTMGRAVDLLASGKLTAGSVVTHHFPLQEAPEAFRITGSSETLKVVIDPNE